MSIGPRADATPKTLRKHAAFAAFYRKRAAAHRTAVARQFAQTVIGSGFGDARVHFTITGAGEFKARLIRLRLKQLEICCCSESLPRIAYISLPPGWMYPSFPVGPVSLISDGVALRKGDFALHSRGQHLHQRSNGACRWGLIAISAEQLFESLVRHLCQRVGRGQRVFVPLALLSPQTSNATNRLKHRP